jgi:hypothetical protein
VSEEGGANGARQRERLRGMVAMVVRHEKSEGRARRHEIGAKRPHAMGGAYGPNACVNDDSLAVRFDDERISARSAA